MRGYQGRYIDDDEVEVIDRPTRRRTATTTRERDARDAWEPMVCPTCGADHQDLTRVRVRRSGNEYEARCLDCNSTAARFIDGVWSA